MTRNGRHDHQPLALPPGMGRQIVKLEFLPKGGPHAQPISVALPADGGLEVHTWGGFTKLEDAALRIAAGMSACPGTFDADDDKIAIKSVLRAEQVLIACWELIKQRTEEAKNEHSE